MAMDPEVTEPTAAEAPVSTGRLEELYVRNAPGALRLAYFLTGNRELAEDLTRELVPGTMTMSKNNKVVLSAKPNTAKKRAGKSFRSERSQR